MDIILNPHYPMLLLSALTFVCGWLVIPYRMNRYNTEWLPRWIRPEIDIVDVPHPSYYPANESRIALAVALFLAFLCTFVAGWMDETDSVATSIPYIYALLPSAYLLHRYFCFHRLNRFTPRMVARHTGTLRTYRAWLIVLIWLCVLLLPLAAVFQWLPRPALRLLTLLPAAAMLLFAGADFADLCKEYRKDAPGNTFGKCLSGAVPHNYYLPLAIAATLLTQTALWTDTLWPLIGWMGVLAAFSVAEFYLRFHNWNHYVDIAESWGEDTSRPLLELGDELWLIYGKEQKALHRKHRPCRLIIIERGMDEYAAEITADLDNKLRELVLCDEVLVYVHTFPTVREARMEAIRVGASKERMRELIEQKNPRHENWAGRSISFLLNMGANE